MSNHCLSQNRLSQSNNGTSYTYVAINYSALILTVGTLGQIAYVKEEEGTQWLPGSLGGSYYPKGSYLFDGVNWISDKSNIAGQLQENIESIATKLDSIVAGSNINIDITDPLNPIVSASGGEGDSVVTVSFGVDGVYVSTTTNPSYAVLGFRVLTCLLSDYFSSGSSLDAKLCCNVDISDGATGRFQLYNETDGEIVIGSETTFTNPTLEVIKSTTFTLPQGKEFRLRLNRSTSAGSPQARISAAKLIIKPKQ